MAVLAEFRTPLIASPLSRLLDRHPEVAIEIDAFVPTGSATQYVWVRGGDLDGVIRDFQHEEPFSDAQVIETLAGAVLVKLDRSNTVSPVFGLIEEVDAWLAFARGTRAGWTFQVRFTDSSALQAFIHRSAERRLDIQLRQLLESRTEMGSDGFELSPKQRRTLDLALETGYFDVPRSVSLQELADEIGITEQAVSERLRRGLATLLAAILVDTDGSERDESIDRNEAG